MRIVWTRRLSVSTIPEPNYTMLFWLPPRVNMVRFAELDSSDIRGLSAMIARSVPYDTIQYILGATGEGRRQLREDPALPISWIHQQTKDLRSADATCVRTGCVRPMHPVRPDRPPDFFSHPVRPTKVLIFWLRLEATGATQPR